jgi:hypothetical protein
MANSLEKRIRRCNVLIKMHGMIPALSKRHLMSMNYNVNCVPTKNKNINILQLTVLFGTRAKHISQRKLVC